MSGELMDEGDVSVLHLADGLALRDRRDDLVQRRSRLVVEADSACDVRIADEAQPEPL